MTEAIGIVLIEISRKNAGGDIVSTATATLTNGKVIQHGLTIGAARAAKLSQDEIAMNEAIYLFQGLALDLQSHVTGELCDIDSYPLVAHPEAVKANLSRNKA